MLKPEKLTGIRTELIPLVKEDYEWVYLAANDPEIWEQHPDKLRYTPYGFTKFFKKLLGTDLPYVIIETQSQKIIGATSFYQWDEENQSVVIGYTFLAKAYWGGPINREIKTLMLRHAFQKVKRVFFQVGRHNERSKKALAKIGACFDPVASRDLDTERVVFSIDKPTFLKQQSNSE